ncbi:MAG: rhodanese-like domain-containing protein [Rhodospirillales bacterium]
MPAELCGMLLEPGVVLVDVREPAEYAAEHIEGAVLYPLSGFDPARLPAGRLVFQCGSGKRSLVALQRALAAGAQHAAHLAGGLLAWKRAGLPTVQG